MRIPTTVFAALALAACDPAGGTTEHSDSTGPRIARDAEVPRRDVGPADDGPDGAHPTDAATDAKVPDPDTTVPIDAGADAEPDAELVDCVLDTDCDDRNPCTLDMCRDGACTNDILDGCCRSDPDCGDGVCLRALRTCAEPTPVGAVVISELLPNPDAVDDARGEWIELTNVGEVEVLLNGWTVRGDGNEAHPLNLEERTALAPGAVFLLARGADPAENGSVRPDYVYDDVTLSNGEDRVAVTDATGNLVDEVVYDRGFPHQAGASLSLSAGRMDADANDDAPAWCAGAAPWAEGSDRGTPGEVNPECPDREVDWCRLQFPTDIEAEAGDTVLVFGRVFEAGITDRSAATDPDEALRAQLGYGPDGAEPADEAWRWSDAEPNAGWDDADEPGNDEYQGALAVAEPGTYDFALRFSRDGGASWLYCDRAAGPGADGAEDGYQAARAGQLTVHPGPPAPAVGEVRINELLFDVADPLSDADAEWIELRNMSDERRRLDGCALTDGGADSPIVGVTLPPGGYALFARSDDANGGLEPDGLFRFSLNNDGDEVSLRCDEEVIDAYAYDGEIGGDGVAIQRDDEGTWCVADAVYFSEEGDPERVHLGTPGEANRACPPPPLIDFCALQFPLEVEARAGAQLEVFGVVYEPGLTDLSAAVDPTDRLEAQAGVGPEGSDPTGWMWRAGLPNPTWDGGAVGQPNNDEYTATLTVPPEGRYDLAWRFRLDGGAWTYCDRDPGSDDGYAAADAGHLVSTPPPPPPPAGAVRFTEVMYDPHDPLGEADAEWLELTNVADAEHSLGDCVLADAGDREMALDPLTLEPGGVALFVRDVDPEVNGGLQATQRLRFSLGNGGDTLTLTCGAVEVARLAYGVGGEWPTARRYSISLDPNADPESPSSWCRVRAPYFEGHHGTPGAHNPPCDVPVDACRFQHPADEARAPGVGVTAYGRVFHGDVTDASPAVDADALLLAEAGYGPEGSAPDDDWTWLPAEPNAGWDGAAAGEPAWDEYQRALALDVEATYDLAYRVSADGGRTWTLCEGRGRLEVRAPVDPCDELACDAPPEPACADDTTLRFHDAPGVCEVEGDEASCSYPARDVDCAPDICFEGRCAPEGAQDNPRAAEAVRVTEIMYDPHAPLVDEDAEWFELHNTTAQEIDLVGCTVDAGGPPTVLGTLRIAPDGRAVLARSADGGQNGGLAPDHLFDFPLGNDGATLSLRCVGLLIDEVAYDDGGDFPDARAHSISRDPDGHWCRARATYTEGNWGTPGAPNPGCDVPAGWCRLQFPLGIDAQTDDDVMVYARFYAEGITDRSTGNDPFPLARGQLGYGLDGTAPGPDWRWQEAEYNPGWDGAEFGEPNNDEYRAALTTPLPRVGGYDYAYRVTVDDGRTWLLCDASGSDDGYAIEQAGRMDPVPAPCNPNPCVEPPDSVCRDAQTLVVSAGLGACRVEEAAGVCEYGTVEVACACADDGCADLPPAPTAAGDVVVTEVMYNPHHSLADADAEWFELHNPTQTDWTLAGCRTSDAAEHEVLLGDVRLGAGSYALLARSDDPAVNGNLAPDALFDFPLRNGGDTLRLHCGGVLIDAVSYDDGPRFPTARAASLSLDPGATDAAANDDGARWCLGSAPYNDEADNLGSPGVANPACD